MDRKPEWWQGYAQWEDFVASRDPARGKHWPTAKAAGQGSDLLPSLRFL